MTNVEKAKEINPDEWIMIRREIFEKIWMTLTDLERSLISDHIKNFRINKEVKDGGNIKDS